MSEKSNAPSLSRRDVLKRTTAAGSAIAVGSGLSAAADYSGTIDIEIWYADGADPDATSDQLRTAADDIADQTSVGTNITQIQNTTDSYPTGDASEIISDFRDNQGYDINEGQINLLVFSHSPDTNLDVVGLNHQGVLKPDNDPVVVLNDYFQFHPNSRVLKNLAITGYLRPILGGHADAAPAAGDVNSFGKVYVNDGSANEVSPLASWHAPKAWDCPNHLNNLDGTDDNIDSGCQQDDVPTACGYSRSLTSCTILGVEQHMQDNF
ncbi:twin-arginine translocation signal domain-containing protein [Halorussus salinus]|uniref:twin-arginine translocation signal domain-containing protein n=1 Tax=Halorussus salinus TaxID=1364935 RepID=UPI0010928178|nr:twin-arginine translocation signal domain-containing protein [Halorussus salinus]